MRKAPSVYLLSFTLLTMLTISSQMRADACSLTTHQLWYCPGGSVCESCAAGSFCTPGPLAEKPFALCRYGCFPPCDVQVSSLDPSDSTPVIKAFENLSQDSKATLAAHVRTNPVLVDIALQVLAEFDGTEQEIAWNGSGSATPLEGLRGTTPRDQVLSYIEQAQQQESVQAEIYYEAVGFMTDSLADVQIAVYAGSALHNVEKQEPHAEYHLLVNSGAPEGKAMTLQLRRLATKPSPNSAK